MRTRPLAATTAMVVLATASFAQSTVVLTPLNSIQSAVNAASDGDTIVLSALDTGTAVFGDYTQTVSIVGKRLTIEADPNYAGQISVSANGLDGRVFFISGSRELNGNRTTIRGLRVVDGIATFGGGLFQESSDILVTDCVFERNVSTDDGGAVFVDNTCNATFTDCRFSGNESLGSGTFAAGAAIRVDDDAVVAVDGCVFESNLLTAPEGGGGAIYTERTLLTVTNSQFRDHHAQFGAAIYSVQNSDLVLRDNHFENNHATSNGGAVRNIDNGATTTVERCVFRGNSADGLAGALEHGFNAAPLSVTDSLFENNAAGSNGGAIYSRGPSTIVNSFFYANRADRGGGFYQADAAIDVVNSVFVGNGASVFGGAMYDGSQPMRVYNSTFVANSGPQPVAAGGGGAGDVIYNAIFSANTPAGDPLNATAIDVRYTLSDLPSGLPVQGVANLDANPLFLRPPSPGPDGQYIDDPDTAADETADNDYGDLRLSASSPAIDRGETPVYSFEAFGGFDIAGDNRAIDDPQTPNAGVESLGFVNIDLGAYEFQASPTGGPGCSQADLAAPFNRLDIADVVAFLQLFGAGCP